MEYKAPEQPDAAPAAMLPPLEGRLHPFTLAFSIYNTVRRMIIPLIPMLFFNDRLASAVILSALFTVALARALVRYFTFSYRVESGELITRQGIFERTERHIPLERVQEIQIEQGVLHRLFGMVDANIETAGGQGPEATLSVLSRAEAERLREAVFQRKRAAGPVQPVEAPERQVVTRLHLRDLVLAGITSNHLLSALALVGALWALLDDIMPRSIYESIASVLYDQTQRVLEQGARTAVIVAVVGVVAVMLVGMTFSVIGSVALFYGFTLSRIGEDLQRTYGLLTRRSISLPRRRIQVLEINEGVLRRPFHLASLRADTAGNRSSNPEERGGGRDVLLPVARREKIDEVLPVIFPDLEPGGPLWTRVSRLAILRGTVKGAILCLIVAGALWLREGGAAWLWPVVLLPLVYGINVLRHRNLGYMMGERYFRTRRGWLGRSTHIVPIRNAQALVIRQSPFDRRLGLATLIVDTAGQTYTGGGPRISNLGLGEARALARQLARVAARAE